MDAMLGAFLNTDGLKALLVQLQTGICEKVATVQAQNMEHAFTLMNVWPENEASYIVRLKPLHSLSVGDVLVNQDTKEAFMVSSFGFDYLGIHA
jgi:hypothetical protein